MREAEGRCRTPEANPDHSATAQALARNIPLRIGGERAVQHIHPPSHRAHSELARAGRLQVVLLSTMSFLGHRVRLSGPSILRGLHHVAGPNSSTKLSRTLTRPRALQLACTRTVGNPFLRMQYGSLAAVFASRRSPFDPRYFSSNTAHTLPPESLSDASESSSTDTASQPVLTPPPVAYWLLFSSALVFAVIIVGGVTRLTESGLSITEWRPITGILPPLSASEWEMEFEKYKVTPEFKLCVDIYFL